MTCTTARSSDWSRWPWSSAGPRRSSPTTPTPPGILVDQAHAQAKEALTELRNLVRGVHPPVLTDRGLDAALSGLAALCPVPVDVHVDVPVRPKSAVEAVAYFVVAEALTNVAKHSRASQAQGGGRRPRLPGHC